MIRAVDRFAWKDRYRVRDGDGTFIDNQNKTSPGFIAVHPHSNDLRDIAANIANAYIATMIEKSYPSK